MASKTTVSDVALRAWADARDDSVRRGVARELLEARERIARLEEAVRGKITGAVDRNAAALDVVEAARSMAEGTKRRLGETNYNRLMRYERDRPALAAALERYDSREET